MSRLPLLKAKEIIKILLKIGFVQKRQKGSHVFFEHPDGRTTVIPNHPGEIIDRGLLHKIIRHDLMMDVEQFIKIR